MIINLVDLYVDSTGYEIALNADNSCSSVSGMPYNKISINDKSISAYFYNDTACSILNTNLSFTGNIGSCFKNVQSSNYILLNASTPATRASTVIYQGSLCVGTPRWVSTASSTRAFQGRCQDTPCTVNSDFAILGDCSGNGGNERFAGNTYVTREMYMDSACSVKTDLMDAFVVDDICSVGPGSRFKVMIDTKNITI